jgi:hypothetical protein
MGTLRRFLFALLALGALDASAFGPLGHEMVAEIAARELTPAARAEVERLLGERPAAAAMRQWASWPDQLREWPGYGGSAPLHYLNFPTGDCRYAPQRDCPNGKCVVGGIERFVGELRAPGTDPARADALKWVIHLVGDVHVPLHAGWGRDRGGNDVQLQFERRGWNLHALWDSGLLKTRGLRAVPYAEALLAGARPVSPMAWNGSAAQAWAEESCAIVRDGGIYPAGPRIGDEYVARHRPVIERRVLEAGLRLAHVLNAALAP